MVGKDALIRKLLIVVKMMRIAMMIDIIHVNVIMIIMMIIYE